MVLSELWWLFSSWLLGHFHPLPWKLQLLCLTAIFLDGCCRLQSEIDLWSLSNGEVWSTSVSLEGFGKYLLQPAPPEYIGHVLDCTPASLAVHFLKTPGGKFRLTLNYNGWFGVKWSRSFGSLLTGVNGLPFKITSTILVSVRSISSETDKLLSWQSSQDLACSQAPPMCEAGGGLNFHVIFFWWRNLWIDSWFQSLTNSRSSLSLPSFEVCPVVTINGSWTSSVNWWIFATLLSSWRVSIKQVHDFYMNGPDNLTSK